MRSESSIQAAVVKYARSKGFIAIKQGGGGSYGSAGWPDYLFISPSGRVLFIEFKKPGGKVTALQKHCMDKLSVRRIRSAVVFDVQVGKSLIDTWDVLAGLAPEAA